MSTPDGGFDTSNSAGSESQTSTGTDTTTSAASPVQNQQADNPAWKPVLDGMPEMFANRARPHLRQWDDNYRAQESKLRELQERYSPYEKYLNVDPGAIQYGLGLVDRLQADPLQVYNALAEHVRKLGLLQDDNVNQDPNDQQQSLEEEDPRFAELARRQKEIEEQQQAFQAFQEQQQIDQMTQQYESEINNAVDQLKQKFGNTIDEHDLLQRMLFQLNRGEEPNAAKAFEEQKAFYQRMYANLSQQKSAPHVLTPGGQPAPNEPQKNPKDMNESERKAYFKLLLDAANAGG